MRSVTHVNNCTLSGKQGMVHIQKYKCDSLLRVNQAQLNEAKLCLFLYALQKGIILCGPNPNDFGCKTIMVDLG